MAGVGGLLPPILESQVCWSCRLLRTRRMAAAVRSGVTPPAAMRKGNFHVGGMQLLATAATKRPAKSCKDIQVNPCPVRAIHSPGPVRQQQTATIEKSSEDGSDAGFGDHLSQRRAQQGTDIRSRLRRWRPDKPLPPRPVPPPLDPNDLNESTRPEQFVQGAAPAAANIDNAELESFIEAFESVSDYTGTPNLDHLFLRTGDLVCIHSNAETAPLGVFLRLESRRYMYYTVQGKFFVTDYPGTIFIVPNYFSREELEPLQQQLSAAEEVKDRNVFGFVDLAVPRDVSGRVLRKLVEFRRDAELAFRAHASALVDAHKQVAHPFERKYHTLEHLAALLTGIHPSKGDSLPEPLLFAVSNALLKQDMGFTIDKKTYANYRVIAVEPQSDVKIVQKVQQWTRAYQEAAALEAKGSPIPRQIQFDAGIVDSFVRKAQTLISECRRMRGTKNNALPYSYSRTHIESASATPIRSVAFDDDDQAIIRVIKLECFTDVFRKSSSLSAIGSVLLRATGAYNKATSFGPEILYSFLIELGIISPYAIPKAVDRDVLPASKKLAKTLSRVQERIDSGVSPFKAANLVDSMAHMRRDWGNLTVFCIDKTTATDIDDGISFEPVPDHPDQSWVHIHVANVAAFISSDHLLNQVAANHLSTIYAPHGRVPMLPDWAVDPFSLGPGKPTLTFSVRLDAQGRMMEHNIQPGIIHNVVHVDASVVNQALGQETTGHDKVLTTIKVGNHDEVASDHDSGKSRFVSQLSEEQTNLLTHLERLMKQRESSRRSSALGIQTNWVAETFQTQQISHCPRSPMIYINDEAHRAEFETRDPGVEFSVHQNPAFSAATDSRADTMVAEAMNLCGVVASDWAAARNIPLVYVGTIPLSDDADGYSATDIYKQLEHVASMSGSAGQDLLKHVAVSFAKRLWSATPVVHKMLDVAQYTKITSPLRRYFDLVSHFQINAALIEEHRTGRSLAGSTDNSYLPLQKAEVEQLIRLSQPRVMAGQWYENLSRKHWSVLAIARARFHDEAALPNPLVAVIMPTISGMTKAWLPALHTSAFYMQDAFPDGALPAEGSRWEVEIAQVSVYTSRVFVKPVRKLS